MVAARVAPQHEWGTKHAALGGGTLGATKHPWLATRGATERGDHGCATLGAPCAQGALHAPCGLAAWRTPLLVLSGPPPGPLLPLSWSLPPCPPGPTTARRHRDARARPLCALSRGIGLQSSRAMARSTFDRRAILRDHGCAACVQGAPCTHAPCNNAPWALGLFYKLESISWAAGGGKPSSAARTRPGSGRGSGPDRSRLVESSTGRAGGAGALSETRQAGLVAVHRVRGGCAIQSSRWVRQVRHYELAAYSPHSKVSAYLCNSHGERAGVG